MSNRKSLPELQAEYMLRQLQFCISDVAEFKRYAVGVNCSGGIAKDDPTLQRLVKAGHVKIVRSARHYRRSLHRTTLAKLTQPAPEKIDTTCPDCGTHWVEASPRGGGLLIGKWNHTHADNCQLKNFRVFAL